MSKEQKNGIVKIIILVVILIVAVGAEYLVLKKDNLFNTNDSNNSSNQISNEVNAEITNNTTETPNQPNPDIAVEPQTPNQENVLQAPQGDNYTVIFIDGKQYEIHSTATPSFVDWFNEYGCNEGYTIVNNEIYKTDRNLKINMHGKKYDETGLKSFESYDLVSADSNVNNIN